MKDTQTMMTDNIPALTIEAQADGSLSLGQDDATGNRARVVLHPVHLRLIAERMHLTQASDRQALATIRTLERRLGLLRDRISHLAHWLANHSDHDHADLSYETTIANAAADLAEEFCEYFTAPPERPGQPAHASAGGQPAPASPASPAPRPQGQQDAKAKLQRMDEPQLFAVADPAHADAGQPA